MSRRTLAALFVLFALVTCAVLLTMAMHKRNVVYRDATLRFSLQLQNLYDSFDPGQTGKASLSIPDIHSAKEVLYLPAYCPQQGLARCLGTARETLVEDLYGISQNDHLSPCLVWLSGTTVVSVQRLAGLSISLDSPPVLWQLTEGSVHVTVLKKLRQQDPFDTLTFAGSEL